MGVGLCVPPVMKMTLPLRLGTSVDGLKLLDDIAAGACNRAGVREIAGVCYELE